MKPFIPVSGLPRSGSTLLINILAQNPDHHIGPTSGLVGELEAVKNHWSNNIWFKAEGLDLVEPRVVRMIAGMIRGYYAPEIQSNKVIFDKSRGWLTHIQLLNKILPGRPRMIVTIRQVDEIVASMEKVTDESYMTSPFARKGENVQLLTIHGRAQQLLEPEGVIGHSIASLRDAIFKGYMDDLLFVKYHELIAAPDKVINDIHTFFNLEPFEYDFTHIKQVTHENDTVHNMKLHDIRSEIKHIPTGIDIPDDLVAMLHNKFPDIYKLLNF